MIRFHGGIVSGQTGDGYLKPENGSREIEKVRKVKKVVVPEKRKWKIITFLCGS